MSRNRYLALHNDVTGYLTITAGNNICFKSDQGSFKFNIADGTQLSRWSYSEDNTVAYDGFTGGVFICTDAGVNYNLAVDYPGELVELLENK